MDLVRKLVRALCHLIYLKYVWNLWLRSCAPLPDPVLQFEFCNWKFEYDIFANLTINRDPFYARLFHYFTLVEGFEAEASLICICYYEFPLYPIIYLLICLAYNRILCGPLALFKLNHKRASLCTVIISLYFQTLRLNTLELFAVELNIIKWVFVSFEK